MSEASAASAPASELAGAPENAAPANAPSGAPPPGEPASAAAPAARAAEEEGEEDSEDEAPGEGGPRPSYWCHSKKRFAVMFAYSGIGYNGLQINPGARTIEGDLEKAICESGVIKKENVGDLKKSAWSRAARTDKGVHAVGQVVSLKMGLLDQPAQRAAFVDRLNELLPAQIRVYDVVRTTKAFNSKNACSGRKYEYLLPTFLFRPRPFPPRADLSAAARASAEAEEAQLASLRGGAVDDEDDEAAAEAAEAAVGGAGGAGGAGAGAGTAQDSDADKSFYQLFREETLKTYAFDADTKRRLEEALQVYKGTHNFHNFTLKVAPNDPASKRHIRSISVDGPMVVQGLEVLRINIEGQSFMLHQIRKMVGVALETVRRVLPPSVIKEHLGLVRRATPMVPGEGLALRACLYEDYNRRYGDQFAHLGGATQRYPMLDFDKKEVVRRTDDFRLGVLYPLMVSQERAGNVFSRYVYMQDGNPFPSVVQKKPLEYEDYRASERLKERAAHERNYERNKRPAPPGKDRDEQGRDKQPQRDSNPRQQHQRHDQRQPGGSQPGGSQRGSLRGSQYSEVAEFLRARAEHHL